MRVHPIGYGRTTIAEVAREAGVAVETVYAAFGSKAGLLRQVWLVHFRGDENDIPLYDRDEMQAILAEFAEGRLDVAARYGRAAAATGELAIGAAECRDVLFATMDGSLWQRLVLERGWSNKRHAAWTGCGPACSWPLTPQAIRRTRARPVRRGPRRLVPG